jgi:MFS family permease
MSEGDAGRRYIRHPSTLRNHNCASVAVVALLVSSLSTMPNTKYPWRVFWVLLFASIAGVIAVLPYIFSLFGKLLDLEHLTMPLPVFVAVQVMHSSIAFGMVIVLGLLLAPKVGIEIPLLAEWLYHRRRPAAAALRAPLAIGAVVGVVTMLLLFVVFLPRMPGWPSEAALPVWKRLLACFYGGINEELLMRLFVFGVVLWLLQLITRKEARASTAVFWTGNIIAALVFGAAYLPAAAKVIELTPIAIFAIMFLKSAAGIVFGYLCWMRGLEAAMLAHFAADFVLHIIAPLFFDVPVTS